MYFYNFLVNITLIVTINKTIVIAILKTCFPASSVETSDGIEMMVGLEYARRHNMTVEFVITTDTDPWGEIYENWTGTGVVGLLVEDRADFGFSKYEMEYLVYYCELYD